MDEFFGFEDCGELRSTTHCGGGGGWADMASSGDADAYVGRSCSNDGP